MSFVGRCPVNIVVQGSKVDLSEAAQAHEDGCLPSDVKRSQSQMTRFLNLNGDSIHDFMITLHNEAVLQRSGLLMGVFVQVFGCTAKLEESTLVRITSVFLPTFIAVGPCSFHCCSCLRKRL